MAMGNLNITKVQRLADWLRKELAKSRNGKLPRSLIVSKIMYSLNDDPVLLAQFCRTPESLALYMPFTSYQDSLILRFFDPEYQGDIGLCEEVRNFITIKVMEKWENQNKETTPV